MTTPMLQLRTLFELDARGRILSNREPGNPRGPIFFISRSSTACAGAVRADLPEELARTIEALVLEEPPCSDLHQEPELAAECSSLLALFGRESFFGPAFYFPDAPHNDAGVATIEDESLLYHHFSGWTPGEIAAGRSPVAA